MEFDASVKMICKWYDVCIINYDNLRNYDKNFTSRRKRRDISIARIECTKFYLFMVLHDLLLILY